MDPHHKLDGEGPAFYGDGTSPHHHFSMIPATRDRDGNVTIHPEQLEITPVDEELFAAMTAADTFVDSTCVTCGLHAALFTCAGRFVSLCPSCVVGRIELLRVRGEREPAWITQLDRDASKEAAYQAWKAERLYSVVFDDIWKCARCGALIRPEETRYHHAPGENTSPPYCAPCADALRAAEQC